MKNRFWLRKIVKVLFILPLAMLAFGLVVMYLWNATLPAVIHVTTINFWQALGILLLSKILFGGFRGGWGGRQRHWKNEMQSKLSTMTPEEKEKFKQDWKDRCSGWGRPFPFQEGSRFRNTSEPTNPSTD
ncbi:MAG: hypothetical protein ABIN89_03040 [Chitinophagaceae bacterium]